jgi:hypothetical protein
MQQEQLEQLIRIVAEEVERVGRPQETCAVACSPFSGTSASIRGGDVFCIFYCATSGLETVGQQLAALQSRGTTLGCLLSEVNLPESFRNIQWTDQLTQLGPQDFDPLLKGYRVLLLANLSRRGVSELGSAVTTLPKSDLVYRALGSRKRVVGVQDALDARRVTCPDDPMKLTAVQELLGDYLERVKKLGVELVYSEQVGERIGHALTQGNRPLDTYQGFLTLEDLENFQGTEIQVARGTRLTPLAQEWLQDRGVEIRMVDP